MKQSIVEVILYLLEMAASQSFDANDCFVEQGSVRQRLEEVGFARDVVTRTFDWLKELIEQQCWYADSFNNGADGKVSFDFGTCRTMRVFNLEESARICPDVRNFILSLEFAGILDTKLREIVIVQLMQLQQKVVGLADAKWVVLLVLMSKSNKNAQEMRNYLLATMALDV